MTASETPTPESPQAIIEMLLREMDASKSITDHLSFLKRVAAGEPMTDGLRDHLVTHIGEEETEHQEHLTRLLPALQGLAQRLGARSEGESKAAKPKKTTAGPPPSSAGAPSASSGLTVGSLVSKRPWFVA